MLQILRNIGVGALVIGGGMALTFAAVWLEEKSKEDKVVGVIIVALLVVAFIIASFYIIGAMLIGVIP